MFGIAPWRSSKFRVEGPKLGPNFGVRPRIFFVTQQVFPAGTRRGCTALLQNQRVSALWGSGSHQGVGFQETATGNRTQTQLGKTLEPQKLSS
jgi:hypothetical protein